MKGAPEDEVSLSWTGSIQGRRGVIGMAGGQRWVDQKRADRREQNPEGIPQTPWDGI